MNRGNLPPEEEEINGEAFSPHPVAKLSERELQVLSYVAAGFTDKRICQEMGIALNTLRTYWQRIRAKLGQQSRSALAIAYMESVAAGSQAIAGRDTFNGFEIDLRSKTFRRKKKRQGSELFRFDELQTELPPNEYDAFKHVLGRVESNHECLYSFTERSKHGDLSEDQSLYVEVVRDEAREAIYIVGKRIPVEEIGPSVLEKLFVGYWKIYLDTGELKADHEFCKIYRVDPQERLNPDLFVNAHPDDAEVVAETLGSLRSRQKKKARMTIQINFSDGDKQWITHDLRVDRDKICGSAITLL